MQTPALNLTESELAQYDGSDLNKPIYLAIEYFLRSLALKISGDVYDVSSNRRMYGPGGGYGFFSGKDAARAFVTGCFKDDLTHDVRGLDPKQLEVYHLPGVSKNRVCYIGKASSLTMRSISGLARYVTQLLFLR